MRYEYEHIDSRPGDAEARTFNLFFYVEGLRVPEAWAFGRPLLQFSLRSAHVARMAIAGPGWTLHRTDVAVHLSAARARTSHVCQQAGPL